MLLTIHHKGQARALSSPTQTRAVSASSPYDTHEPPSAKSLVKVSVRFADFRETGQSVSRLSHHVEQDQGGDTMIETLRPASVSVIVSFPEWRFSLLPFPRRPGRPVPGPGCPAAPSPSVSACRTSRSPGR